MKPAGRSELFAILSRQGLCGKIAYGEPLRMAVEIPSSRAAPPIMSIIMGNGWEMADSWHASDTGLTWVGIVPVWEDPKHPEFRMP
jgi:hypothetical protein